MTTSSCACSCGMQRSCSSCGDGCKGGSPACESSPASGAWESAHAPKTSRHCMCRAGTASATGSFAFVCIPGAPRPIFKLCLGPVCSGDIRAGFSEGRRKGNTEHPASTREPAWLGGNLAFAPRWQNPNCFMHLVPLYFVTCFGCCFALC